TARADGSDRRGGHPSLESPIFDITHFDVIPLTIKMVSISCRPPMRLYSSIVTPASLIRASRASGSSIGCSPRTIADRRCLEQHRGIRAAFGSTAQRRFPLCRTGPATACSAGLQLLHRHDRQYSLVKSFGTPWTSSSLPSTVGTDG